MSKGYNQAVTDGTSDLGQCGFWCVVSLVFTEGKIILQSKSLFVFAYLYLEKEIHLQVFNLGLFPMASVTNDHKLSDFRQQKSTLSQSGHQQCQSRGHRAASPLGWRAGLPFPFYFLLS